MATGKALDGKPYAGNPHVRFDEGEVAPAAKPRRGSLLYRKLLSCLVVLAAVIAYSAEVQSANKDTRRPAKAAVQNKTVSQKKTEVDAQQKEKKLQELESINKKMNEMIVKLRSQIDELNQEIVSLRDDIEAQQEENEELSAKLKSSATASPAAKSAKRKTARRQATNKIEAHMAKIILPRIAFKPPATVADAIEYFRRASIDFDDSKLPEEQRGFNFSLQAVPDDGSLPTIPTIIEENVNFLDALDIVLSSAGYKFVVQGSMIVVTPKNVDYKPYTPRSHATGSAKESKAYKIEKRMKNMMLSKIAFKSPATILDAVDYFRYASIEFGDAKLPKERRGLDIAVDAKFATIKPKTIPFLAASNISCWDALRFVCQGTGCQFEISDSTILISPKP